MTKTAQKHEFSTEETAISAQTLIIKLKLKKIWDEFHHKFYNQHIIDIKKNICAIQLIRTYNGMLYKRRSNSTNVISGEKKSTIGRKKHFSWKENNFLITKSKHFFNWFCCKHNSEQSSWPQKHVKNVESNGNSWDYNQTKMIFLRKMGNNLEKTSFKYD